MVLSFHIAWSLTFRASNTIKKNKPRWPSRKWIWAIQIESIPVNSLTSQQNKLSKYACCWVTTVSRESQANRAASFLAALLGLSVTRVGSAVFLAPISMQTPFPQHSSEKLWARSAQAWLSPTLPQWSLTGGSRDLPKLFIMGTDYSMLKATLWFLLKKGYMFAGCCKVMSFLKHGRGFIYSGMRMALTWAPITYFSIIKQKNQLFNNLYSQIILTRLIPKGERDINMYPLNTNIIPSI